NIEELDIDSTEGVIVPGGIPGTPKLEKVGTVHKAIDYAYSNDKYICAICAAPSILGHKGILKGRNATCFTGFEKELEGALLSDKKAVADGKIITAVGAGASFDFGFAILAAIKGADAAEKLKSAMKA
ncbi:MAG: DJ-1/PfpI family protein, partial [Acutalibacteraceae bacterium]